MTTSQNPVAAAQAKVDKTERDLAAAQEALELVEERRDDGDPDLTGQELLQARADVEVAEHRLAAAKRQLKVAERSQLSTDTTLADLIAPVLGKLLPVEVTASSSKPTTKPKVLPSLAVVQSVQHQANPITGTISGPVLLLWARTALHRPLDADAVINALSEAGIRVNVRDLSTTTEADGREVDLLPVEVEQAHLPLPVILPSDQTGFRLKHLGEVIVGRVEDRTFSIGNPQRGVHIGSGDASQKLSSVIGKVIDLTELSDTTDADEQRTRAVRYDLSLKIRKAAGAIITGEMLAAHLERVVEDLPGTLASGVGVVKSAKVRYDLTTSEGDRGLVVEVQVVSQIPGSARDAA